MVKDSDAASGLSTLHLVPDPFDAHVPACLHGFTISSGVLAECLAPIMHKSMTSENRVENALTGHLMMDVGAFVASMKEKELKKKRGILYVLAGDKF